MTQRPAPISEELLDKMVGVLEGPVNKLAERALSSTIVLAPLSLSMNLGLRVWRRALGTGSRTHDTSHSKKKGGAR